MFGYRIVRKSQAWHAQRLANALDNVLDDMLGATDFGMSVKNEEHPFHDSVKEAREALKAFDGIKR